VDLNDVLDLLPRIALAGKQRCYNVASGILIEHARIGALLESRAGWPVEFAAGASLTRSPRVDIARIAGEFGFSPTPFEASLDRLLQQQ
jgi:hypothetical protein